MFNRRSFIAAVLLAPLATKTKKFVFKIKTKSGSIIGNIAITAKDSEAAKYKLRKRYPDCEIMEMTEK